MNNLIYAINHDDDQYFINNLNNIENIIYQFIKSFETIKFR